MTRPAVLALAVAALLALASPAQAREAYVANSASSTVTVFETAINAPVATIPVGVGPSAVAITPDGSRAYVTNSQDATISVLDTATKGTIGSPIPVGDEPRGIAIDPGGTRAYVANSGSDSISVVDLAAATVIATVPLEADSDPQSVAVAPDGATAYVTQKGGDVARIVTATNALASAITTGAGLGPSGLSLTPDGEAGFLANSNSSSASVFATATATILGSPTLVGANPVGVAVNPNGPRTYVAAGGADAVVAIDSATHLTVGAPIPGFQTPAHIAVSPDGSRAYVTDEAGDTVTVLDTLANAGTAKIGVGQKPQGIAIVPNQGPRATFSIVSGAVKAERLTAFDASASTDPDGRVAAYVWDFGDGEEETTSSPLIEHVYAKAGNYTATLRLIDAEDCSSERVFTGQTVSCNGSAAAVARAAVEAIDATPPSFNLFAAPRQPLRRYIVAVGRCPQESCRASVTGHLSSAFKRARGGILRAKGGTRPAKAFLVNGVERKLKLRIPGPLYTAARRALARGGKATIKISASARDQAGNPRRRKVTVHLFAPRVRPRPQQQDRKRVSSLL